MKQHRDKHVSAFFCLSLRFVLLLFCVVFAFCIVFDLFFWRVHLLLFALFFFPFFFHKQLFDLMVGHVWLPLLNTNLSSALEAFLLCISDVISMHPHTMIQTLSRGADCT